MNIKNREQDRLFLLDAIQKKVLLRHSEDNVTIVHPSGDLSTWLLDFRKGFSDPAFLQAIARLFWEEFEIHKQWQIGGMESASLPLVTTLSLTGKDVRSFYIRKSRKKQGLLKQIEGDIDPERDIILVDDLMNSGSSFLKQIEVLERELNRTVKAIFCIVRFRDLEHYKEITNRGIEIKSLFELPDLGLHLNVRKVPLIGIEEAVWRFQANSAHYFQQGPKNIPLLYRDRLIHTTDDGMVWQFNQTTGEVEWSRRVMFKPREQVKPFVWRQIHEGVLYLATYRGSLLALDARTGTPRFKLSVENAFAGTFEIIKGSVVGGVSRGRGQNTFAVVAVDVATHDVQILVELKQGAVGRMLVDEKRSQIIVADRGNTIYCVTTSGVVKWIRECGGTNLAGVGTNKFGDAVVINSEGVTMVLHPENGKTLDSFTLPEFHATPPTLEGQYFYGATLGRVVYRYDYLNHKMDWSFEVDGRMYSAPALMGTTVAVGDNNGRVYILDKQTGKLQARAIFPERITNPILVTPTCMLISTFANDLYMLKRTGDEVQPEVHEPNHRAIDLDSIHRV